MRSGYRLVTDTALWGQSHVSEQSSVGPVTQKDDLN